MFCLPFPRLLCSYLWQQAPGWQTSSVCVCVSMCDTVHILGPFGHEVVGNWSPLHILNPGAKVIVTGLARDGNFLLHFELTWKSWSLWCILTAGSMECVLLLSAHLACWREAKLSAVRWWRACFGAWKGWGETTRLYEGQQPIWPKSFRLFPSQPCLPTAIFTTIFWQVRVIEQAFVIWQTSLWLPCLGSENAPRVVVFNTLLIGPHSNSGCNVFWMIRGNVLVLNVLLLMKMWHL